MRDRRRLPVFALVAVILLAAAPEPSGPAEVELAVRGQESRRIGFDNLDRLPQQQVDLKFLTGHGEEHTSFTGPLLWAVLDQTGVLPASPRERVPHLLLVTGHDGYTAALALAEIDPEFEGKQVLLARQPDAKLRLVVPGDRRGGRNVRDVARIEVE
jgi:hypothetical protein